MPGTYHVEREHCKTWSFTKDLHTEAAKRLPVLARNDIRDVLDGVCNDLQDQVSNDFGETL